MPSGRITIDPLLCHGHACIPSAPVAVHQVLRDLARGESIDEVLARYPPVQRADVLACLDYAADLLERQAVLVEAAAFEQ